MKLFNRDVTWAAWDIKQRKGDDAELYLAECVARSLKEGDDHYADYWTAVAYKLAEIEAAKIQ